MKHVKLDRIDLKILSELQKDGRMTNVDLAEIAGISAPPCLRRVRALEQAGFIRGYHADVAPDKMGFGIAVFTQVSLAHHTETDINNFIKLAEAEPHVRECFLMTGDCDFLLKIVAEDWDAFQKFITSLVSGNHNIQHVKSMPVMRRVKYDAGVPIEEEPAED